MTVSVVTTCYNVAPYIRQTLESALGQSMSDLELIAVDDESTDETRAILESVKDPRLKVFYRKHAGPIDTLNFAISQASGEFVAFLDGDDLWAPGNLAKQIQLLRSEPDCDLSFALSRMIDEQGNDLGPTSRKPEGPVHFRDLLIENYCGNGSAIVVRRSALAAAGELHTAMPTCHDYLCWLRVALLRPGNIRCVPEILVLYRRRKGQLSGRWKIMQTGWLKLLEEVERQAPEETRSVKGTANMNMHRYFGYLAMESGELGAATSMLLKAFAFSPGHFISERRNYLLAAGILTKAILPGSLHRSIALSTRRGKGLDVAGILST